MPEGGTATIAIHAKERPEPARSIDWEQFKAASSGIRLGRRDS